ncbi:CehA/McbA family metallohydrolase [bacterium]|nr:CehA/McbA family metallohydrolase [bacterium]
MKRYSILFILLFIIYCTSPRLRFEIRDTAGMRWYKGNTHTHAREGESDSTVPGVAQWYKDRGYSFLVITDHSVVTYPPELTALADSSFLLMPGEEIMGYSGEDLLEINGLNIREAILPWHGETVSTVLQELIDDVRRQNGVPVINHPNFQWRLDRYALSGAENCNLFELYNGCPGTNNEGDENHPGLEEVWDFVLTSGRRMYGIASDDGHEYKRFSPELSNPGRGWIVVQAMRLEPEDILRSLESGLFYSSTGVGIRNLHIQQRKIEILIEREAGLEYKTEFIGSGGKILRSTKRNPAVYHLSDERNYVRAKITDSKGRAAWMQPVFVVR